MTTRYLSLAAVALLGCDALVGGECADGYAPHGDVCAPMVASAPPGAGGGGGPAAGTGGEGGTHPIASGGASGSGGAASGGVGAGPPDIAPVCLAPTSRCGGACVDLGADPLHCGGCNVVCATGLCDDGACVGSTPGHVVVIGLSYATIHGASRQLLGNALFLPMHDPVEVLTLRGGAAASAYDHVASTLALEAASRGRGAHHESVDDPATASDRLEAEPFDLFLVLDQPGLDAASAAADVGPGLTAHLSRGGTVVVLSASPAMGDFVHDADLLDVEGVSSVTGDTLENVSPSSALGLHVPTPFFAGTSAATFDLGLDAAAAQVVLRHPGTGAPAAVHRTVTP